MQEKTVGLFVASFLTSVTLAVIAADFTSSGSNLTARVDEKFVDPLSIVNPPGSNFHFRADLGFLVFDPATFDATNLLAVPTAFGAATVFPVSVSETNGTTGRERLWSVGSGVVWTTLPPASYSTTSAVESVFGSCPAWENLESYVAERDPWRQTVSLTLVGTDNIAAVETVLSNALAAVQGGGGTNLPWTTNDLAFISIKPAADGSSGYAFVPTNVPLVDLFGSTSLIACGEPVEPGGWNLLGQQTRSGNPMAFTMSGADLALLALGSTVDSDGDGLTDARERLLTGTSTTNADSDADGLTDGEEFLQYRSNPHLADTDGDGLLDGWEAANGLSSLFWHDANAVDGDTLTPAHRQQLGISTGHVEVVDVAASNVLIECRSVSAARSKQEGFADFVAGTNFYLHFTGTISGGWGPTPEAQCDLRTIVDSWSGDASVFLNARACGHTGQAVQVFSRYVYPEPYCTDVLLFEYCTNIWSDGLARYSLRGHQELPQAQTYSDDGQWAEDFSPALWGEPDPNFTTVLTATYKAGTGVAMPWSFEIWMLPFSEASYSNTLDCAFDTETLVAFTQSTRSNAVPVSNLDWGVHAHTGCTPVPTNLLNLTNAAVRMLFSNEVACFERELNYRIRVTNSIVGVVYRATVAHVFTPTNGTSSVIDVKCFIGKGSGTDLVLKEDGAGYDATIPPPSNGTISVQAVAVRLFQGTNDITSKTIDVNAGARLLIDARAYPTNIPVGSYLWTPGSNCIRDYTFTLSRGEPLPLGLEQRTNTSISMYGTRREITRLNCAAKVAGQWPIFSTASFNVLMPAADVTTRVTSLCPQVDIRTFVGEDYLRLAAGDPSDPGVIWIASNAVAASGGSGSLGYLQLVHSYRYRRIATNGQFQVRSTGSEMMLDSVSLTPNVHDHDVHISTSTAGILMDRDSPSIPCDGMSYVGVVEEFQTFLMFRPDGSDSVWVPVKRAAWMWYGSATNVAGVSWTLGTNAAVTASDWMESEWVPTWSNRVQANTTYVNVQ